MQAEAAWSPFYAGLLRTTGLDLNLYKQDQLRRRIDSMVEQRKVADLTEFGRLLQTSREEMEWFLDKLAINVSELYRNPEKWAELETTVLPELLQAKPNLRCWSAGCSFGAEAYSLATLLDAKYPGPHSILGTDIDTAALSQAKRGEFSPADMKGVPKEIAAKYFTADGELFRASSSLSRYLTFRKGNLLADRFEANYDLILCRNVVIYFNDDAKAELYQRFYNALRPGGYLFVGSTERIFNSRELGFETPVPFFYRKPLEGQRQWRNAS